MTTIKATLLIIFLSTAVRADNEEPDMEFLEWLGQVTEIEEMGVDINGMLEETEQQVQREGDEENS